ncbi:thermonuclease family protein [Mesorhizobium sp. M5C.F.Cr.IN.023.01.1.1]|nr:thermonuclease family protein [Mesorhizobium sp. M5C.F.Cr.IN.023.01.1.1]
MPPEATNALRAAEDVGRHTARLSQEITASETRVGDREVGLGALVAAAVFGAYQLSGAGGIAGMPAFVSAPQQDLLSASFPICGDGPRVTCVVDGDTFWHQGVKIRIADIDTPELSPPRCEAERTKGEAAKRRLRELLNAGKFSLVAGWRDEDQHGRKLRTVTRNGHSIGQRLIAEGLARRWDGGRRNWCD